MKMRTEEDEDGDEDGAVTNVSLGSQLLFRAYVGYKY